MPRTKSTATLAACNGCACCSRNPKDHTCPIATKVPPQTVSKEDLLKPIKAARKENTPTARQIASAPIYKPGEVVKLPRGAKPSTDKDYMRYFAPELCGGPPLRAEDREWLVVQIADATWKQHPFTKNLGVQKAIRAFKACKIVVNPWDFDWFTGFVNSRAAGKKRKGDNARANGAALKEESEMRFDDEDFEGLSNTQAATYQRLAKQLAYKVADRDDKERPSWKTIQKDPYYWLDVANRAGDACAGCLRKFGGRYGGMRFLIWLEHRHRGPHAGELSDAPSCKQCNTASRARSDDAAGALDDQGETYTLADAGTLANGRLTLMGRGSDDAAARNLALLRAATVTRSADDKALAEAQVSTPARNRGDGVERFDGNAFVGPRAPTKSCPACSAMIPIGCWKNCPECGKPCTKKRKT